MIQTKIVATLGPASDSRDMIKRLIDAGVDIFRLNLSHGALEQHARTYQRIRAVCEECGSTAAVMADLCGPKIRIDPVEDDAFEIAEGDRIEIVEGHLVGDANRISTNHPDLVRVAEIGHTILIDDGLIRLRVQKIFDGGLACVCEIGGVVRTRKGVNLPDTNLAMSAMTEKDREDLAWVVDNGLDYVALSFVRSDEDIEELRDLMPGGDKGCQVVAKIETAQAVDRLDAIIEAADVVLVARGDLGVEMDIARVPLLQKRIIHKCQAAGKPVITATQMLQSMVSQPAATRAEVSDVANAILDATDCVMLSAETSVGAYPVDSVKLLKRIGNETEGFLRSHGVGARLDAALAMQPKTTAVAHGASLLARELDAKLVAVWSRTGRTSRLLSKTRLNVPIIGLSPSMEVCRRMAMYYGVVPIQMTRREQAAQMLGEVDAAMLERGLVEPGDLIVVVAGTRLERRGETTALLVHLVGDVETAS